MLHELKKCNSKCPVKVSVCIVTYNQENYIDECLKGIVSQNTNFEYEVIVSDDGSADRTRDIINQYAKDYPTVVVPVFREKNLGAFKNFVETHNLARGEYVCHCDGDDRWLPNKLQAQADFLDANPDFTVVWGRMNLFDDFGGFYSGSKYDYSMFENGVVTFGQALSLGSVASHSSIMYRGSARKTRSPSFEVLDLFYTWEFLSQGTGKILNQILGEYRVAAENSLTCGSGVKTKKLYAQHTAFYYEKFPDQRRNIFIFSLLNLLVDIKNRRLSSAVVFLRMVLKTFSFVTPLEFLRYMRMVKKLSVPKLDKG